MTEFARQSLVDLLRLKGIKNPSVLKAIAAVPREKFISTSQQAQAYDDNPLPIGEAQTISQPYIVALMTEYILAADREVHKVLEIGTGSGYQAAILAQCVPQVFTIERIQTLYQQAKSRLQTDYPAKIKNKQLQIKYGDGYLGWPEQAPFDGILVTAATAEVPEALPAQLSEGGRLVIPVGDADSQYLLIITRRGEHYETQRSTPVRFVPLCKGLK